MCGIVPSLLQKWECVFQAEELEKLNYLETKAIKTKAKAKGGKTRELCSVPH